MKLRVPASVTTVLKSLDERRTLGVAAEMSFWLFCSLLPLVYSAMTLVILVDRGSVGRLAALFSAVPDETKQLISRELGSVLERHAKPSAITIVLGIWLASSGIHAIFDGFDAQLGTSTPWLHKRLRSLGGCVALSVGTAIVGIVVRYTGQIFHGTAAVIVGAFVVATILYLVVAGLYRLGVPSAAQTKLPRAPGTVVVVGVVAIVAFGYRMYLRLFGDGSAFQAGLSVIVTTLTGLYLFSVALLLGLYVNQRLAPALESIRESLHPSERSPEASSGS